MGDVVRIGPPPINDERVVELCERFQIMPPDANRLAEFLGGMMHGLSLLQDRFDRFDAAGAAAVEYSTARTVLHLDVTRDFLSIIGETR